VLAGNCHGFIGNRMLEKYSRQSREVVLEGSTPWEVDQALQGFGMAMGPYRMYDVVGVDLGWRSRQLAGVGRGEPIVWLDNKLCEMERFGQKSGHGFYTYEKGSRQAMHDPETDMLAREVAEEAGYTPLDVGADEIVQRCILALVNEGARILDEGFAESAEDIDRVYLYGYGFPAERGGPMSYADSLGLNEVLKQLRELEASKGNFWKPADGLVRRAESGERFTKG
jgi:3-hydroxyacyl-CoA dehydrogenase